VGFELKKLNALKAARLSKPGRYGDGGGLWLQVSGIGAKSWLFRYTRQGRARQMGLGSFNALSLTKARDEAEKARGQLAAGIDPIETKRRAKAENDLAKARVMTFKQCGEAYIAAHKNSWRNPAHARQWPNSLRDYVYPLIGNLPVADVDTALCVKILEAIWQSKPETASRVRMRLETVLAWATARGYRTGDNPARWRGHIDQLLPARKSMARVRHHPALPYTKIGDFIRELRDQGGIAARALEFTILAAARTSEVTGARWAEIDLSKNLWTIPGERMKSGREHRVALSKRAVQVLGALPREGEFVFPGGHKGKPLSNMALLKTLARMGRDDITVHGFRSTFRDWAAEQTNYPRDVAEMALAHVVGDKTEAAYRRGDMFEKRRQLAEAWAQFCEMPSHSEGVVVPIRAGSEQ